MPELGEGESCLPTTTRVKVGSGKNHQHRLHLGEKFNIHDLKQSPHKVLISGMEKKNLLHSGEIQNYLTRYSKLIP